MLKAVVDIEIGDRIITFCSTEYLGYWKSPNEHFDDIFWAKVTDKKIYPSVVILTVEGCWELEYNKKEKIKTNEKTN